MNLRFLFSALIFISSASLFAQSNLDKLYFQDSIQEVNVKEVTPVSIRFSYPNESAVYTMSKMLVSKIQFSSGREEIIEKKTPESIHKIEDSDEVYIAIDPIEVQELQYLGKLRTSVSNVGSLTHINIADQKQLSKIKLEAAMMGANVILLESVHQTVKTQSLTYNPPPNSSYYDSFGASKSTVSDYYSAFAYRSNPFDLAEEKEKISTQEYHLMTVKTLNIWSTEIRESQVSKYTREGRPVFNYLEDITLDGDRLMVSAKGISDEFDNLEVIDVGEDFIVLAGSNKNKSSNFFLYTKSYVPKVIPVKVAGL